MKPRIFWAPLLAVVALVPVARPGQLGGQVPGGGATAVAVSVSKPLMGENYDPLSGLLGVEARIARSPGSGLILHGTLLRSSAGRTVSTTLANPTIGVWMRPGGIPVEVEVSVPLMREFGEDNFASDIGRLSDQQHRERYLPGRWAVSAALTPHMVFRDGSSGGVYLGGVGVLPKGERDLDLRARYEVWFSLRFSPRFQGGTRFAGTVRVNGEGGFDQRTQQDLSMFVTIPGLRGYPELSFRLPVDIDLQDYVTGVVALRLRF